MSYRLELEIDAVPQLDRAISKRHWSAEARMRRQWRELVVCAVGRRAPSKALKRASVVIDCWRKGREPDPGNLIHSMKPVIDGLLPVKRYMRGKRLVVQAGAGVLKDDAAASFVGGCYVVRWHHAAKGQRERLRIVVEESAP